MYSNLIALMLVGLLSSCVGDVDNTPDRPGAKDGGADTTADATVGSPIDATVGPGAADAGSGGGGTVDAGGGGGSTELSFFYGYFTYTNTLPELQGHSNVVLGPSTFAFIEEARSRGIQPIVWLATVLQLWDFVGDKAYLKSNYLEIWNAYAQQIAPYIDDIYGFYPVDEPFWGSKLTVDEQNLLNQAIKASFPNKPIMTTFARPTIDNPSFVVPSTYDYVGYDNYYGSTFASDKAHYEVLKTRLSPGQKIFLIGDAFAAATSISTTAQQLKANKIYLAYELATTPGEPIVGILNYVWDSFSVNWPATTPPYYIGVDDMPEARQHFINVGQVAVANQ